MHDLVIKSPSVTRHLVGILACAAAALYTDACGCQHTHTRTHAGARTHTHTHTHAQKTVDSQTSRLHLTPSYGQQKPGNYRGHRPANEDRWSPSPSSCPPPPPRPSESRPWRADPRVTELMVMFELLSCLEVSFTGHPVYNNNNNNNNNNNSNNNVRVICSWLTSANAR